MRNSCPACWLRCIHLNYGGTSKPSSAASGGSHQLQERGQGARRGPGHPRAQISSPSSKGPSITLGKDWGCSWAKAASQRASNPCAGAVVCLVSGGCWAEHLAGVWDRAGAGAGAQPCELGTAGAEAGPGVPATGTGVNGEGIAGGMLTAGPAGPGGTQVTN